MPFHEDKLFTSFLVDIVEKIILTAITKPPSNAKSKYASGFSCPYRYSGVDLKKTKYAKKAFDIPAVQANNSRHENNLVLSL